MRFAVTNLIRVSLLAVLVIGGQSSICNIVSLIGIDAHHHDHAETNAPICVESHSDCHGEEEERVPCPEDGAFELADILLPDLLQTPECPVDDLISNGIPCLLVSTSEPHIDRPIATGDPPGRPLSDRRFTGRFLV